MTIPKEPWTAAKMRRFVGDDLHCSGIRRFIGQGSRAHEIPSGKLGLRFLNRLDRYLDNVATRFVLTVTDPRFDIDNHLDWAKRCGAGYRSGGRWVS